MASREKIKLETFLMATIMPYSKNRCTEGKKIVRRCSCYGSYERLIDVNVLNARNVTENKEK